MCIYCYILNFVFLELRIIDNERRKILSIYNLMMVIIMVRYNGSLKYCG